MWNCKWCQLPIYQRDTAWFHEKSKAATCHFTEPEYLPDSDTRAEPGTLTLERYQSDLIRGVLRASINASAQMRKHGGPLEVAFDRVISDTAVILAWIKD